MGGFGWGILKILFPSRFLFQKNFRKNKPHLVLFGNRGGARNGSVVWHTHGSGKSLNIAMLAKQNALHMPHQKIVFVTDCNNLDQQITITFEDIEIPALNAATV
jgi:type I site-specific restriction-modification system R (restriction) subunit